MKNYYFPLLILFSILINIPLQAEDRPNIIIILTDDMGFSDLGCFGGEIETPNLDSLAAKGLRFTDFYNTSRCWPTRATLMSGRYSNGLSEKQITIPQILKQAGYQTAMSGKWHLSKTPDDNNAPVNRGFDDFYGTITGAGSFWEPLTLSRNNKYTKPDSDDYYYTDKIGEEAARQIKHFAKSDKPFFQYVAFTAAHWPLHAPEKSIQKYIDHYKDGWEVLRKTRYDKMVQMEIIDPKVWPLPDWRQGSDRWEDVEHKEWHIRNMAIYAAMVDHMDQAVGEIIKVLKKTEQYDNTLIMYMHDNGACREHLKTNAWNTANNVIERAAKEGKKIAVGDVYDVKMGGPDTFGSVGKNWAHAQNSPLKEYKANGYEGGICTPAIMHWPKGIENEGSISRQRGHVIDLMATCLELSKAEYPAEHKGVKLNSMESKSLVNILRGKDVDRNRYYLFNHAGQHGVIKGDYKILRTGKGRPWKLFNLKSDRTETVNLAQKMPEKVKSLAVLWEKRYKATESR